MRRLAHVFNVDGALAAAIATRLWSGLAGIVTLGLIAHFLGEVEQGYYYAFWSLIALQSFAELGLLIVIVAAASHEWAHLSFGPTGLLTGSPRHVGRFVSLARFVSKWFAVLAGLFILCAGMAGSFFLDRTQYQDVSWRLPWLASISLSGMALLLNSALALLEGCNQIGPVNRLRLAQAIASSVVLWTTLYADAGLWSIAAMLATSVSVGAAFVTYRYRGLLKTILTHTGGSDFSWRVDIWPMQWPLALQGVAAYFMYSLFVPVTFAYEGAAAAGRIGMAMQIAMAIGGIASTWITVRMPQMGVEFASFRRAEFERLWRRSALASIVVILVGTIAIVGIVTALRGTDLAILSRLPAMTDLILVMAWACCGHLMLCMALYWRAMKRELTGPWGAVPGVITGVVVWICGRAYGATGAVVGALAVSLLVTLPLGLIYLRRARALAALHVRTY